MFNEEENENGKEINTELDPDGTPINGYEIAESKKREANEEENDFFSEDNSVEDAMNDLNSLEGTDDFENLNDLDSDFSDADGTDNDAGDAYEQNDNAGKAQLNFFEIK